ncbi:soluble scavenger receptor cysteine-rich domain-containing protein SSC5D-like [Sycon ciliatum]|uniref:soluble scavenger receptor cysteine-rich domain-containing protein SSC5D-like n=1 Tax=Sycon ciliatum TaxID=27933 RepID=UPI0020ACD3ED|eukprot:scpid75881/ scgid28623/ Neurotrypsin; Brain-specific serine protease 3; Motopsin; Serine protease 12
MSPVSVLFPVLLLIVATLQECRGQQGCSITCGDPTWRLRHGHVVVTSNTAGSVATIACRNGYEFRGTRNALYCLTSGEWTRPMGGCRRSPLTVAPTDTETTAGIRTTARIAATTEEAAVTTAATTAEPEVQTTRAARPAPPETTSQRIRLVGGLSPYAGRLEVYHSGEWGTVCDDGFGLADATVACRQLGHSRAHRYNWGEMAGRGRIWLDNLRCFGLSFEKTLFDCRGNTPGIHDCSHSEDVTLECVPSPSSLRSEIRLAQRFPAGLGHVGRLEIMHNGQWGTVCDTNFASLNANVACKQLGYARGYTTNSRGSNGRGPIWLDNVRCQGREYSLKLCPSSGLGQHSCSHSQDIWLQCSYV